MGDAADRDDEAWLFGEAFDLESVLARGRGPTSRSEGSPASAGGAIRAFRIAAAWLAGLAAIQFVCGVGLLVFAPGRIGGPFVAAAAVAGIYAVWLALTPVPTAWLVAVVAMTAIAASETAWAARALITPDAGGFRASLCLCPAICLLAWTAVAASAWTGWRGRNGFTVG